MINFPHGIMFHHFHDNILHFSGQGSISSDEFRKIITYLKQNYNLLSPEDFIYKLNSNKLSKHDITLTFDDALRCQYDVAIPIMQELSIKAFFFVYTNAFSDQPDPLEFYRDVRNNFFENIDEFYKIFFDFCNDKFPTIESNLNRNLIKNYLPDSPFYSYNDRKFRFIRDRLLSKNDYYLLMENIIKDLEYSKSARKNILFMNLEHLKSLIHMGHNVGMHSSSHPINMHELDKDEQLKEYEENFEFIKKNLGFNPNSMSHPCGRYNSETLNFLDNMNIQIGFRATINNEVKRSKLEIPREDHTNVLKLIG